MKKVSSVLCILSNFTSRGGKICPHLLFLASNATSFKDENTLTENGLGTIEVVI